MSKRKSSALRIYVQTDRGFARLFRVDELGSGEESFAVNLVVHGLESRTPTLVGRWPDRRVSTADLQSPLSLDYTGMEKVGAAANHLTVHVDGTVHLRLKDGEPPYYRDRMVKIAPHGPLGRESSRFWILLSCQIEPGSIDVSSLSRSRGWGYWLHPTMWCWPMGGSVEQTTILKQRPSARLRMYQ